MESWTNKKKAHKPHDPKRQTEQERQKDTCKRAASILGDSQRSWPWAWAMFSNFEAGSSFEVSPAWTGDLQRLLPAEIILWFMALNVKLYGDCLFCCISLLSKEVTWGLCCGCEKPTRALLSNLLLWDLGDAPSVLPLQPKSLAIIFCHVGPHPADNLWQALHSLLWLDLLKSKECLVVVQKQAWKETFARSNPEAPIQQSLWTCVWGSLNSLVKRSDSWGPKRLHSTTTTSLQK